MATTHAPVETLDALLDRLVALPPTEAPFISLYLDARANERGRDQIQPFVGRELRARRRALDMSHDHKASYDEDVKRIEAWMAGSMPKSANGAAVFACAAASLFEAVALEAPFEGHQLHVDRRPHVYPLLHLMDYYRRYAAVVADREYTRIFVFGLNTRLAAREVEGERRPRAEELEGASNAENRYQRHVEEHAKQNFKEVAHVLDAIVRAERLETVILAGDDVALPMLRAELSPAVAALVADSLHLDHRAPEHEVLRATLEAFRAHDARTDAEKVQRAVGEYRAGGLGVVGLGATRLALEMGQVDELLLAADRAAIVPDEAELEEYGPELRSATAEDLATRARQTDAKVTFIEDARLLAEVGGVAGLLRFRIAPRGEGSVPT